MKLDGLKRIIREDFDEKDRDFVDKLAFALNPFLDQVSAVFSKNIDLDNLKEEEKDIEITVDMNGIPISQVQFKNTLNSKIRGTEVIKADNLTDTAVYPTGHPFISFVENNKLINILHVTGLQANNKYKLRIRTKG